MNLYQILDVPTDADAERIRQAYRRAAMAHHPDRGGDTGDFQAMQNAYDVLGDPERRQRYDETGETGHEDDLRNRARAAAAGMIEEAVGKLAGDNDDALDYANPVQAVRDHLHHTLKANAATVKRVEKTIRDRETAIKRLRRIKGEGECILSDALRASIETKKAHIEGAAKADALVRAVLDVLADYDYESAPPKSVDQAPPEDLVKLFTKAYRGTSFFKTSGP